MANHGADGEIFAPFDQALPVRRLAVLLPDFSEHGVAESLEVFRVERRFLGVAKLFVHRLLKFSDRF